MINIAELLDEALCDLSETERLFGFPELIFIDRLVSQYSNIKNFENMTTLGEKNKIFGSLVWGFMYLERLAELYDRKCDVSDIVFETIENYDYGLNEEMQMNYEREDLEEHGWGQAELEVLSRDICIIIARMFRFGVWIGVAFVEPNTGIEFSKLNKLFVHWRDVPIYVEGQEVGTSPRLYFVDKKEDLYPIV